MKPNPIPVIAMLLLLCLSSLAQDDSRYRLLLKNGAFIPEKNITTAKLEKFNGNANRSNGKTFAIIQFEQIPTESERQALNQNGVELLDYIPNNAYTVIVSGSLNTAFLQQIKARAFVELTAEQKMEPTLATGNYPPSAIKVEGTIDVRISFPRVFSFEEVSAELKNRNFDIISTEFKNYHIIGLRIFVQRLKELAMLPVVEYVEPASQKDQPLNFNINANSKTNILGSSLPGGRNLKGNGVVVGVGDESDPLRHVDMSGRIINHAAIAGGFHGMYVEGIVGGAGIIDERFAGVAPKATIIAQGNSGILANSPAYVQDYGMVITNNSYGGVNDCTSYGTYTLYSGILDQQAFDMPQLQHVFAAGNSGNRTCSPFPFSLHTILSDYQSAKNVITVGNTTLLGLIATSSSKGPVSDGRIKPEITAQGFNVTSTYPGNTYTTFSGTSSSAPAVAGGLALLNQRYRQLHSGSIPKNGLMKALLCNGATDMGNSGPDYSYGFGWMNLLRSVKMLEYNNYINDSVNNAVTKTHSITIPVNTAQLKVMLYWNDPASAMLSTQSLVNDLDLEVVNPSSLITLPFILDTIPANTNKAATNGVDHINNIEQVVIVDPSPGVYTVRVKGTSITQNPRQEYFLVYDTIPVSTTLTFPTGGEHLIQGETIYINWDCYGDTVNTFNIEFSTDNGSNWTSINANVAANLRILSWTVPNVTTDKARVRIKRNSTSMVSTSEVFTIIGIPTVTLSSTQCEGYISIDWTAVSGSTDYEIMMLKGDEMVSRGTTIANTYAISGLSKDTIYWVSVRARLNGNPGRRATAISRQPNSGTCLGTISDKDIKLDTILSPASSGRKFTSSALSANVPITIRIKNLDDAATTGNITVSYSVNGGTPVTEIISNPNIAGGVTYNHTFAVTVNMSAIGIYALKVIVSQVGDPVIENNSLTKIFKQLDNPAITLTTPFLDNIETASLQSFTTSQIGLQGLDRYDFVNTTAFGRIRTFVSTGISYSGSKAFTLDADRYTPGGNTDSLTGTFNIATYNAATDDIRLDFRYKNHGQVDDAANKVWARGNDQQNWIQVYDLYANQNQADEPYKLTPSIEVSDALIAAGQNFSSSFQVRWGQWGEILTADYNGGAGYSFDDIRLYKAINDIQLIRIDSPLVSSCGLGTNVPVKVTVRNSANTTVSNIPIVLKVDGTIIATETISSIAGNASISYTFNPATANLSSMGSHTVEVWVDLPSDNYHNNDSAVVTITNSPIITVTASSPYLQNFETNNGSWFSNGMQSSWQYGTPSSIKIKKAASGIKVWKTRLNGNHNNFERSYLYSPCFNVSALSKPMLSLSIALDLEDCGSTLCDGAYVEYSSDGKTWNRLGTNGQGTNWYNKNYAGNRLWSIENYTRWHVATFRLPAGLNDVHLRFVLSTDPAVNGEGVAIDDVHIYDSAYSIYDGPTMSTPITQNITAGTNWVDFISAGKIIASVQPSGQVMGNTDVQAYINTTAVRNNNGQYYLNRNITIKPANEKLADSVRARIYFLDSESDSLINAIGCVGCTKPASAYELGVSKYSDSLNQFENGILTDDTLGSWKFIPSSLVTKVPYLNGYYAEFKTKGFSEFWLNNGGPGNVHSLRLEFLDFTVQKSGDDVLINWATVSENNIIRYEIEVAKGETEYQSGHYIKIAEVTGAGNTNTVRQYSYTDNETNKSGMRYYRLKVIYADGGFTYSEIRSVAFNNGNSISVYPNPSEGVFNLIYQFASGQDVSVQVHDASGKLIQTQSFIASGFPEKQVFDFSKRIYAKGLYLLSLTTDDKRQVFKLIKL